MKSAAGDAGKMGNVADVLTGILLTLLTSAAFVLLREIPFGQREPVRVRVKDETPLPSDTE